MEVAPQDPGRTGGRHLPAIWSQVSPGYCLTYQAGRTPVRGGMASKGDRLWYTQAMDLCWAQFK